MTSKLVRTMMTLTVVCATLFGLQAASAADHVPSDRLLPPKVFAYVSIPSVPDLKERWGRTLLGKLSKDEALSGFLSDLQEQWEEFAREIEQDSGIKLDDVLAVPSGEIALAVVETKPGQLAVVGLIDFGQGEPTVQQLLEKADVALKEKGAKTEVQEIENTTITVYSLDADQQEDGNDDGADPSNAAKQKQMAYFIRDTYLVAGSDVTALEAVLQRWDGKHEQTLAEHPAYRYITQRCRNGEAPAQLTWFVDPLGLVNSVTRMFGNGGGAGMFLGFLPALGLSNLKAIGGTTELATDNYDSVSRSLVYVEFPTTGLLNMFRCPEAKQGPPDWITAEATSYFGLNWDIVGAYSAVEQLVDMFQGPGSLAKIVDGMATRDGGPKVHLKEDVVNQLSGRIHVASSGAEEGEDDDTERFLIALEVRDADKMQSVLSSLASTEGFPGEAREFRGHTIYEFESGEAFGRVSGVFGVAVTNGHLMITSDVQQLEEVIRGERDRKPLTESPQYQAIASSLPAETSIIGFQRDDAQVEPLYELLRNGLFFTQIDFSKLPPFEAIRKYLPATGSYAVSDEHGVFFVSFSPRADAK